MKINKKDIRIFLLSFLGFLIVAFYIYFSQRNRFDSLIKEKGRYTVAIGKEIEKRRTGWAFKYKYKANNEFFEGVINYGYTGSGGLEVGGIYFVVFNREKPKKSMLISYPVVPAEINLDSIPIEGWSELPIPIDKDSINHFLD